MTESLRTASPSRTLSSASLPATLKAIRTSVSSMLPEKEIPRSPESRSRRSDTYATAAAATVSSKTTRILRRCFIAVPLRYKAAQCAHRFGQADVGELQAGGCADLVVTGPLH